MRFPQRMREIFQANQRYVEVCARRRKSRGEGGLGRRMVVVADARPGFARAALEALGLGEREASVVALADAAVTGAYGEGMRSVLAAVAQMRATDVLVVGCAAPAAREVAAGLAAYGLAPEHLARAVACDPALRPLLAAAPPCDAAVRRSVFLVRNHPLMPRSVDVWGLALDPATGRMRAVP